MNQQHAHCTIVPDRTEALSSLLAYALAYARKGWRVFPCHTITATGGCSCGQRPDCDPGKHPRVKDWPRTATTEEATIRYWWTKWPEANVAILTGKGRIVLDIDPDRGGADTLAALEATYGPLPETIEVLTGGGGRHLYYQEPEGCRYIPSDVDVLGPGIDIRADGGCIIAPPSLHKSGKQYTWEVLHSFEDLEPAPLPEWVRARVCPPPHTNSPEELSLSAPENPQPKTSASKDSPEGGVFLLANTPAGAMVFPLPAPLTPTEGKTLQRRREVVERILPLLGLAGKRIGEKFCCVLHPEQHPSAAILAPREGHPEDTYVYADFHAVGRKTWPLAVIYWARKTGKAPHELPEATLAAWTSRMLIEAGVLAPSAHVHAQPLPPETPASARRVYEGFCFLLQCKWQLGTAAPFGEAPSPFSWRFAAEWTGLSAPQVGQGIRWCLAHGYMVSAGWYKKLALFLLGTLTRIRQVGQRVLATVQQAHTALGHTLKRLSRTTHAIADALWTKPCAACGSTTYDLKNDCHQCLMVLNAKLHHRRQTSTHAPP